MTPGEARAMAAEYESAAAALDTWNSQHYLEDGELRQMAEMAARRQREEPPPAGATREELIGVLLDEMFPQIGDAMAVLAMTEEEQ